jgi:adenylyl- and sulfurtransferase ThiI
MLVLAHPSAFSDARELAKVLSRYGPKAEDGFVVLETAKAQEIAKTFGVAKVSIVVECENQLGAIARAMAEVGRKTVAPGQSFFVRARVSKERSFASRDAEFAATGALMAGLAGTATAATSEREAHRIISAYVGRRAFVAIKEYEGAGGAIPGSKGSVSCALTGAQSLAACAAAAKAGFELRILLAYGSEDDLRANARHAAALAEMTDAGKQELSVARLAAGRGALALELAATLALARMKSAYVVLPISLATHPEWFIKAAMKIVHDAGKVPLAPLMFSAPQETWQDMRKTARVRRTALSRPRCVRLEVGPDYFHDIIDSV